jgi:hypothetical protein
MDEKDFSLIERGYAFIAGFKPRGRGERFFLPCPDGGRNLPGRPGNGRYVGVLLALSFP